MYDFYGVYASCRDAAWRCQLDFGIARLPVKLKSITAPAGIKISRNSDAKELREGELGASVCAQNQWMIVYDDSLSTAESRMVIAHELGHILLGHEYKYTGYRFPDCTGKQKSEREADMFAVRLLAPACILHELGATSPAEIARVCDIPASIAAARAKRMSVLESRQSYYKSPLERDVAVKFSAFVEEYRGTQLPLSVNGDNPSSSR